jgi:homogentisate phytyltransferase / homogentisate geranylgeranyltransferase
MAVLARLLAGAPLSAVGLATALVPALLINVYIVGLNQVFDVQIDAINKPHLPLAAGDLSMRDAVLIVVGTLVAGLAFCFAPGATPALRSVLIGSALLGTLYSAPPFRLKRFALLASVCILSVRGLLINSCFYMHSAAGASAGASTSFARTSIPAMLAPSSLFASASTALASLPPLVSFSCAFFVLFGIVIAFLKDIPDVEGDLKFAIRTFSVQFGTRTVLRSAQAVLLCMYTAMAYVTFRVAPVRVFGTLSAVLHVIVGVILAFRGRKVATTGEGTRRSTTDFYMDVWKAFYLEYALLLLAAL